MAINYSYTCDKCKVGKKREDLVVKRVQFTTMGAGSRIIRSRVKQWLCVPCVKNDPDWNLENRRAPGERSAASDEVTIDA